MHARWTLRPLVDRDGKIELGGTVVELAATAGVGARLRLDVYDGGGVCASLGVWRVAGRVWGVVEAGHS